MPDKSTSAADIANAQQGKPKSVRWVLENPIRREGGDVTEVMLRKPLGGDLRGLNGQLVNGDFAQTLALIPKISTPYIDEREAEQLEAEDIAEAAGLIASFFWSKSQRVEIERMTGRSLSKE